MKEIKNLEYKLADGWDNHYNRIVGDSPFAEAVNEISGKYWVNTGRSMPLEDAMWSVMADLYNRLSITSTQNP